MRGAASPPPLHYCAVAKWKGRRLLTVSSQVRILPAQPLPSGPQRRGTSLVRRMLLVRLQSMALRPVRLAVRILGLSNRGRRFESGAGYCSESCRGESVRLKPGVGWFNSNSEHLPPRRRQDRRSGKWGMAHQTGTARSSRARAKPGCSLACKAGALGASDRRFESCHSDQGPRLASQEPRPVHFW